MNRPPKTSQFGYLVKLKYYALASKWDKFFDCANVLMCVNEINVGEILHLSLTAPQTYTDEFERKWELEISYYFSTETDYYVPTADESHNYIPPYVSTPRNASDLFLKHRQMKFTSPLQLLPIIKHALESHDKAENIEGIYNHHSRIFDHDISELPVCIESYYVVRVKHPLIAVAMLGEMYWSVRDLIVADARDIAIIVLLSKNYDLVVDFVVKHQRKIYRQRKINLDFDQLVEPAIKEIMFDIHNSTYTHENPPRIAMRERKHS